MNAKVVIFGGHGKVAMRAAKLLAHRMPVISVVRSRDHFHDITMTGATPALLSLEDASLAEVSKVLSNASTVIFSAGAGGRGGPERTRAVDYAGAIKVFDALESMGKTGCRLIMVSAIDTRDLSKPAPSHYNEEDLEHSKQAHEMIGKYYDAKYDADKSLVTRKFPWTILRPGTLSDEPGTGKVALGKVHLAPKIPRDDVAALLDRLVEMPEAKGLVIDAVGGDQELSAALDEVVKQRTMSYEY